MSKLTEPNRRILGQVYGHFAKTGRWPSYSELQGSMERPLAPEIEPLVDNYVCFTRPFRPDREVWLPIRGLATVPEAQDDLGAAYRVIRAIGRMSLLSGTARITVHDLATKLRISKATVCRSVDLIERDLIVSSAFTIDGRNSDGAWHDLRVREYARHFADVLDFDGLIEADAAVQAIRESESRLNGAPRLLRTSKRKSLGASARLPAQFHRLVEAASRQLLEDGHYSEAVRSAFHRFEAEVQQCTGLSGKSGRDLMATAFGEVEPLLRLFKGDGKSERSRQEGLKFLAMGAMLAFRNPYSHGPKSRLTRAGAEEQLAFASQLFRMLDRAKQISRDRRNR